MLNNVVLMGRLTSAPELKTTQTGVAVCSFTIAVERDFKKQGEERQTDFINCVAWKNNAEFISKYFSKGQMIAINGSLQQRSYTDKSGNKRIAYDVVTSSASFCGDKNNSNKDYPNIEKGSNTSCDDKNSMNYEEIELDNQDLPF